MAFLISLPLKDRIDLLAALPLLSMVGEGASLQNGGCTL